MRRSAFPVVASGFFPLDNSMALSYAAFASLESPSASAARANPNHACTPCVDDEGREVGDAHDVNTSVMDK
eukprot:9472398-Pyramimonas_sp.AAC.1